MHSRTGAALATALAISALLIPIQALQARSQGGNKKPSLSLKATPAVSFAPARVVVVAEIKGGADDFEEFYCPSIEWDWGDLTTSTATADCEPYEPGKSQIKRRYTVEHRYPEPRGIPNRHCASRKPTGSLHRRTPSCRYGPDYPVTDRIGSSKTQIHSSQKLKFGLSVNCEFVTVNFRVDQYAALGVGWVGFAVIGGGTVYQRPSPVRIAAPNPIVHATNSKASPVTSSENDSG